MSDARILARLTEIVADILELDELELRPESVIREVEGWDSISNVEIMVAAEQAFGMRFRTGEMATVQHVGDLVALIAPHVAV